MAGNRSTKRYLPADPTSAATSAARSIAQKAPPRRGGPSPGLRPLDRTPFPRAAGEPGHPCRVAHDAYRGPGRVQLVDDPQELGLAVLRHTPGPRRRPIGMGSQRDDHYREPRAPKLADALRQVLVPGAGDQDSALPEPSLLCKHDLREPAA